MKHSRSRSAHVLAALACLAGCSSFDDARPSSTASGEDAEGALAVPRAFDVAHAHPDLGTPSFVWLTRSDWPRFTSAERAARAIIGSVAPTFRLDRAALSTLSAPVLHDTGRGPIVARFAQRVGGVEVFRGGLNVMMSRSLAPVAASGLLAANLDGSDKGFTVDSHAALGVAHRAMTGEGATFTRVDDQNDYERFISPSSGPSLDQPARAKRVLFPKRRGVEPAWYVEIMLAGGEARSYVISAVTGRVLFSNDLVRHDAFTYRVWASPETKLPMDGPQGNATVPLATPSPIGFKATFIPQQLVTLQNFPFSKNDPWLVLGATDTRGNNVEAYSDVVAPNGLTASTADTTAIATSPATFDYVCDTAVSASKSSDSVKAAVTQMFYTTNFLHDWYYDAGFDEKSGNHQADNFGRGGYGRDALRAETQDFSGRNNANAATPADGAPPRIQMYLFGGPTTASLDVTAAAPLGGIKTVGTAGQFGKDSFLLTAQVVLATDSGGIDASDACEPLAGPALVAGKIALVHRGNCSFVKKAQTAFTAGAAGVLVANVEASAQPTVAPFMGGTASDVNIAALSLSLADGKALEGAVAGGANVSVTMKREASRDVDGALDTAIVSHEWGHVLSNRLVADGSGLDTNQAGGLGEGWGDFSAMLVTVKADDALVASNAGWAGVYPSASYASSDESDFYFGIRRVPYSTDMTKDPLTFKHISDGVPLPGGIPISFGEDGSSNSEVHNTGEVWATMLWECYASLLASGRLSFSEAQDRMKGYLVASLKLTPPSPTLLEARDAVIAAAYATDPADFDLFWRAFAKRGAGVGALGPATDSRDNRGVTESFVVGNAATLVAATLEDDVISCDHDGILDEGEVGTIEITVRNSGAGTLSETTAQLSAKGGNLTFADAGLVRFDALKPFEARSVKVQVFRDGAPALASDVVDVVLSDPSFATNAALRIDVPARYSADEAPETATTDTVETTGTSWVVSAADEASGATDKWARVVRGGNNAWFIPNAALPADHRLTSPAFDVEGPSFGLSFRHRWSFESSAEQNKDFDGGVVEISTDGGKVWQDISTFGAINYNVTLDADPSTTQALKGRKAFGNASPGFPDAWVKTEVRATLPESALPASVQIRFRVGSDDNTAAVGWEIDDIALEDVASKPFWSFIPQRDQCDPAGPTVSAGPGKSAAPRSRVTLEGSGTHPKDLPLTFRWKQVAGPQVELTGKDSATLSFDAPDVGEPVVLSFALRAHDGSLLSAPSTVDVAVNPAAEAQAAASDAACGCKIAPGAGERRAPRHLWMFALPALAITLLRRRHSRARAQALPETRA